MNQKIKLIWDFHGSDAKGTAEHHVIHLKQFMAKENISFHDTDVHSTVEFHQMACITVDEKDVITLRDALKPHRAFVVD